MFDGKETHTLTVTLCSPVFYSFSSCRVASGLGRRQDLPYFSFFRSVFPRNVKEGSLTTPFPLAKFALFSLKPGFPENRD